MLCCAVVTNAPLCSVTHPPPCLLPLCALVTHLLPICALLPPGELIAETSSAPLGTRYLKVSDYFTPDEAAPGQGLGPGSGIGPGSGSGIGLGIGSGSGLGVGITGGGQSHGSGSGARTGASTGTGATVAQQAAAAVYRPHAVGTTHY